MQTADFQETVLYNFVQTPGIIFCSQSHKDFEKVNRWGQVVHLRVCLSVTAHISETSEAITIKFGTVTASVMIMHQVLIILTLTFIQGHTDLNHKNKKCLITSETVQLQAMPKYAMKIVLQNHKCLYYHC